jgi:hypothetical protein
MAEINIHEIEDVISTLKRRNEFEALASEQADAEELTLIFALNQVIELTDGEVEEELNGVQETGVTSLEAQREEVGRVLGEVRTSKG